MSELPTAPTMPHIWKPQNYSLKQYRLPELVNYDGAIIELSSRLPNQGDQYSGGQNGCDVRATGKYSQQAR